MTTTVAKEIARLEKMIERKEQEIKEHKELIEMWKSQDNTNKLPTVNK